METVKASLTQYLGESDLLRASLLLGKIENPDFDMAPYVEAVMRKINLVWKKCQKRPDDVVLKIEAINTLLFEHLGFASRSERDKKVIDDPEPFYLHRLWDKKKGNAFSISLLYWIISEQLGIPSDFIAFPGQYILRVKDVAGEIYIDPYGAGKLLTQADFEKKFRSSMQRNKVLGSSLFEQLSQQQLVGKLIQSLKHAYLLKNDSIRALRAVELLTLFYPESPELTRDRGILYCEIEYFSKAIEDLSFYLKARPKAEDRQEIKKLASLIQGYMETMN